jgi:alanyl-tRNA synthetase
MRHHTATHVINASARTVLGKHIWQAGSQLDENEARLDVAHYKRISLKELREIEKKANEIVRARQEVKKYWMKREEAEKKYGLHLYQGGAPKGRMLRIVEIPGIEVEACGGVHVDNTAELGFIKIIGTERVQDGVERIKFTAGEKSIEYVQRQDDLLKTASDILNVESPLLPKTVKRFFEEWKQLRKQVEKLQKQTVVSEAELFQGIKIIIQDDLTPSAIKDITQKGKTIVISGSATEKSGMIRIAVSSDVNIDCSTVAQTVGKIMGGSGGGKRVVAQSGGPNIHRLEEAKKRAVAMIKKQLKEKDI